MCKISEKVMNVFYCPPASDGSIVFVTTITQELLHLAWWHFLWVCILAICRTLLNVKVNWLLVCFLPARYCF